MNDDQLAKLYNFMQLEFGKVRTELKSGMQEARIGLKADITAVRADLKADVADARDELKTDIAAFRSELKSDVEDLRTDLKADINRVYNLLDADTKTRETDEQERLAMTSQLDRQDKWITKAARQLKIKYDSSAS